MAIKFLLPSDISHFFFFDAEQLDEFFKEGSAKRVKKGVVDVSQISLLHQTISHLEVLHGNVRRATQGISPQTDRINRELGEVEEKLRGCKEALSTLDQNQRGIQDNLDEIQQRFRASTIEEVRRFEESRERLDGQIRDYESQLDGLREQAVACLRETGPLVYAFEAIKTTKKLIQEQVALGKLPLKIRSLFFEDLLAQGRCVCGQELAKGSDASIQIQSHLEKATQSDYLSEAETGKYVVNHILRGTSELVEKQRNLGKEIHALEGTIEETKRQLRELSEKIEKYGEINLEEIKVLEQQHVQYQEEQRKNNQEIGRKQVEEKFLGKELSRLNGELERAVKKDQKQKDLGRRLGLCTEALQALNEIRSEMLSEVRSKIQQKTEEYFLDLIWKKATYKRVSIDDNFQINVLNVRDMPSLGTLSAGERQVLALAFMAALSSISGFDAPVIIDTPTGRISGVPRENIAESLPGYLADTQVTLLMTDTEFTEPVQVRLNERIGQEYSLNFFEDDANTEVVQR